jgi:alpha-beta hydrolase superfamily lysophospholipase
VNIGMLRRLHHADNFRPAAVEATIALMIEPEPITLELSDGYQAFARWWSAAGTSDGVAVYLHGIQSHGGWFTGSGSYLASHGVSVLMPDRRGSGRNRPERGHARSARQLVEDALEAVRWAQSAAGAERVYLVGVSWGGKLALAAQQARPESVSSLSLVAPGLFPKVDVSLSTKFSIGLAGALSPRRRFDIPLNRPELFTANPQRIRFIREDPLRLQKATASFLIASRRLDAAIRRAARGPDAVLNLLLAEHDDIIDNERTKAWARDLPWPERRITQYQETHHTLEFEPTPEKFFSDLLGGMVS